MKYPPVFVNADNEKQSLIIAIGCFHLQKIEGTQIDEIIQQIKSFNPQMNQLIEKNKERELYIQGIQNNFEKEKIELTKQYMDEIHLVMKDKEQQRSDELESTERKLTQKHNEDIQHLKEQCQEKIQQTEHFHKQQLRLKDDCIQTLQEKQKIFNVLIEKKDFTNSKEKGDYAENWVFTFFNKGLSFDINATICDTSKIAGSGDGIIHIPSYNLYILIEIKNKTAIDEHDLKQFEEHCENDFKTGKINLAILLSFNQQNIRGHQNCIFHQYDQRDSRMIYNSFGEDFSFEEKHRRFTDTLKLICEEYKRKHTTITDKQDDSTNIETLEMVLSQLKKRKASCECQEKDQQKMLLKTQHELKEINTDFNRILKQNKENGLLYKINKKLLDDSESKQVLKQLFIQKVKDVLKEKDINITPNKWRQKIKETMCLDEYEETILKRMKLDELTID